MGTSISHPSVRNTNWKPVLAGYTSKHIPETRIVNEIWRASEKDAVPMSQSLKSDSVFACYKAVSTSSDFREALNKYSSALRQGKSNSMVAEFAKRAIPLSFQSNNPSAQWPSHFFSEITSYVVSRDLSGFIGDNYRNKSVKEAINFKKSVIGRIKEIVGQQPQKIRGKADWDSFVDKCIAKLKSAE